MSPCLSDGAKEAEHDRGSIRNPNAIDENNEEFQQLEDKSPDRPTEEKEERADNVPPEREEANFSDNRESEEGYDGERGSLLEDASFGSLDSEQSAGEDTAAGNLLELGYSVLLLLQRSIAECFLGKCQGFSVIFSLYVAVVLMALTSLPQSL